MPNPKRKNLNLTAKPKTEKQASKVTEKQKSIITKNDALPNVIKNFNKAFAEYYKGFKN